jgi:hypothetical protein
MIKRLLIFCFLAITVYSLQAQKYGNEWINYNQKHYRINLPRTGLYRIDSAALANSGIPVSFINPKNFQLFVKGQEQYIRIAGESDNVLNTGDFIEFFAERNDGQFDSLAYSGITRLPNPYVALFNDTSYAYLTWNSQLNNRRVIPETDLSFGGYTATPYYYSERIHTGSTAYSLGRTFIDIISDPRYVVGEGYGLGLQQGQTTQTAFANYGIYQSPSLPIFIKTAYSGASENYLSVGYDHQIKMEYLDNSNNVITLHDTTFLGYQQFNIARQIPSSQVNAGTYMRITSVNNPAFSGITNVSNVHYIYFKYPQIADFSGSSEQVIFIDNSTSASKTFLDLPNVASPGSVLLYDLTNHKFISTIVTGTTVKALIPNGATQKKCFLSNVSNVTNVTSLAPVNQSGFFVDYKSSNADSAFLIVSHKGLQQSANDYKLYRQSIAGGSHQVIVAYIDELYDQFAYGNKKNPLAIKNFCSYLSDSLPTPPGYLMLIGKSIKNDLLKTNSIDWNACDLPTMGIPSSDNLITAGIRGSHSSSPFIPVGRISAKTNAQVGYYLDKVKSHEAGLKKVEPDDWHKHVLHFAGGTDLNQQQLFQSYLQSYSVTICDTLYGGKVFNFKKTTTAPIQITISDSVKRLIDYGASIITFFGHGSISGFDQAIDDPNAYSNKDKYPLFIANSCYSGDIHTINANSASENFTMIPDKGSIGFIASSSSGIVYPLNIYSSQLYKSLAYERYYKGIGDAIKNTCTKNAVLNDQLLEITSLEMTLEGDPAVKLNAHLKPDYQINNASVYFDVQSIVDSVGINIVIKNLGKAIRDTFVVRVERYFATGDSVTYFRKIKAPYNLDTLSFNILKDYDNGIGLNGFKVFIDSYNEISELSEYNNSTTGTVDLFIPGGDVVPVYPYKYAIIPNVSQITLKASTADPFAALTNYRVQLDTNDRFINPINTALINSAGGVVEWTVNLPLADSTVYFWRISKDSTLITDSYKWRESSFQVIDNKSGWGQSHFHQFKNDGYQFVKYKKAQRKFDFENDVSSITCRDGFLSGIGWDQIMYSLNSSQMHVWGCAQDGWSIVIFDSTSALPRQTISANAPNPGPGPYGNCHCDGTRPLFAFDFGTSNYCGFPNTWQNDLTVLLNSLPVNTKILAYSAQNHQAESYTNALYTAFESFGSAQIRNVKDTVTMILFGRKGMSIGQAHEELGAHNNDVVILNDSIRTNWSNGYIASEIIGPSFKWNSLHWKQWPVELPNEDTIVLKVVGIKVNGARDTLASFTSGMTDIYNLDTYADAADYPYIQLVALMRDDVYKTPPQMKRWQVLYDAAPECAINPKKGFVMVNDSLQEGEKLALTIPIENIGVKPFPDSLIVTYWVEDQNRIKHFLPQKLKASPFVPAQVILDTIRFDSYEYPGQNYLWIDVNPPTHIRYQKEQYHFNNIARIPFRVNSDHINPLLDVTFDGTHILNGDIVSSKPHILVTLKDENRFLALNDTSDFAVFIKYPDQPSEKRIFFSNTLLFTAAQLPNNSCKIEWKPEFALDGKYKLIVQAKDRTSNTSGDNDYTIEFEVINKQTITEVLNYPNPFSTSTRFIFTLTGSDMPDIFIIQIMTITGKVVREITKNELGTIRIGRNITDYAWDGKDQYGDKLGNGVYLYRVITRYNGEAVEKRQTEADSYFKKGWGKMVIMR